MALPVGSRGYGGGGVNTHQKVGHLKRGTAARTQLVDRAGGGMHHDTSTGGHVGSLHQVYLTVEETRHGVGRHALRLAEVNRVGAAEGDVLGFRLENKAEIGNLGGNKVGRKHGRYRHVRQGGAGTEGVRGYLGRGRVDRHGRQALVVVEGLRPDTHHSAGKVDGGKLGAGIESAGAHRLYAGEVERRKTVAAVEGRRAYRSDR